MNTKRNCYLIKLISYVLLFIFLGNMINKGSGGIFAYGSILLYLLNSLTRMYILKNNTRNTLVNMLFGISVSVDATLILYFLNKFGVFSFIVVFPMIMEVVLFYKQVVGTFIIGVLTALYFFSFLFFFSIDIEESMFCMGALLIFVLLCFYLKEIEQKKLDAHELYDKLRISEENLIQANNELLNYSETIEELAVLRERTRVSRELHDSIGHSLSTLCIQLKAVHTILEKKPQMGKHMLMKNIHYVQNTLEGVRRTVRDMTPKELEIYSGIIAIERMIKDFDERTGIQVKFIVSKEKWALDSERSHNLYRIVQESLSNSLRHGKAEKITVSLQFISDRLYMSIKDDGVGSYKLKQSFGLKGIEDRVKQMRGEVTYETEEGKGFTITLSLPKMGVRL